MWATLLKFNHAQGNSVLFGFLFFSTTVYGSKDRSRVMKPRGSHKAIICKIRSRLIPGRFTMSDVSASLISNSSFCPEIFYDMLAFEWLISCFTVQDTDLPQEDLGSSPMLESTHSLMSTFNTTVIWGFRGFVQLTCWCWSIWFPF